MEMSTASRDPIVAIKTITPITPPQIDSSIISEVDRLILALVPTTSVIGVREAVTNYVKGVSLVTLRSLVFPTGIFCRDSFSAYGDMDLTVCLPHAQFRRWYVKINEALCTSSLLLETSAKQLINVENVQFVADELQIVKATINSVSVDITANNLKALYHEAFLEKVDEFVGRDNLFKRSLLLLKAWFYFESPRFVAGTNRCFGDTQKGISSTALSVMLVHLFNVHGASIVHPLQSICAFLEYFSAVDWDTTAVAIDGLVHSVDLSKPSEPESHASFFPVDLLEMYKYVLPTLSSLFFLRIL